MKQNLICIICPKGCPLTVETNEAGEVLSVSGNTCKRGETYGRTEISNPMRTVTSTVLCDDGSVIAVKTSCPIAKADMAECMKVINGIIAKAPISVGDVIKKDVFGADIVATANSK
jgi:CxxC motif-containing protein